MRRSSATDARHGATGRPGAAREGHRPDDLAGAGRQERGRGESDRGRGVQVERRGAAGLLQEEPPAPGAEERRREEVRGEGGDEPAHARPADRLAHGGEVERPEEEHEEHGREAERDRDPERLPFLFRGAHRRIVAHTWSTLAPCAACRSSTIPSFSSTTRAPTTPRTPDAWRPLCTRCARTGRRFECPPDPARTLQALERVHEPAYVARVKAACDAAPAGEPGAFSLFDCPDNPISAATFAAALPRDGARPRRRGRRDREAGPGGLRRRAPAGPPRARHAGDGLLLLQHHRRRGEGPRRALRGDARPRGRLRRPPRERHAGDLLGGRARGLPLGPPVPVLPGDGRRGRGGRGKGPRHDRQRPPARGGRGRRLRGRVLGGARDPRRSLQARVRPHLRGLRRPRARPAGRDAASRPRGSPG